MKWQAVRFSNLFRVKHGYAFKSRYFDSDGPYILLTPGSFHEEGGYRDQGDKTKFYTGDVPDGFVLDEGDLIVAMTEQAPGLLGSSAWIPASSRFLHNQRLGRIIDLNEGRLNKRFLYYLFNTREVRHQISGSASGTKVRHTAPERIGRVTVSIPPITAQRRIADILSAYDALIENNRRRMALLEEAARQLYREWFIRLRFPGHEHTRITNGMPEGWEKVKVGSLLLKVSRAKKIKKDNYALEGAIPCVDQGSDFVGGYTDDLDALIEQPLPLIVFGDHTRVLKFVNFPFACGADGTQLIYPNTPKVSSEYLFFALKAVELSNYFYARHFKFLKELEVFIPWESLVREFTDIAAPCFEQIKVLRTQNEKLRAARDLLLPRLMSGEISV